MNYIKNCIIKNLKIKQESPEKYNYIENIDQNTSFYSTIELLSEENSYDDNTIYLKYIINNIENKYNNNKKLNFEKAFFIENKEKRNDNI